MAVLAALIILGLALAGPAQAAPQLAERAQIAERIVAQMERKSAYFRILFEDHPHERANFIRELEQARRFGGRESMLVASIAFGSRMGWNYFPYYYARTSDAAVLGFARMTRDVLSVLRAGSYEDCYDYMAGSSNDRARIFRKLTRTERRRIGVAMTQIVVESRRKGGKGKTRGKPDPSAYRRPVNDLLATLTKRLGRENLVHWKPGLRGKDQEKACDYAVAFFEEVLKQPKRDGVLVLRAVFGG
jgi:hypothetical protein